jgi:hypothetical protein
VLALPGLRERPKHGADVAGELLAVGGQGDHPSGLVRSSVFELADLAVQGGALGTGRAAAMGRCRGRGAGPAAGARR